MPRTATADRVDRDALIRFLRPRHRAVLLTRRRSGGVQLSPVTCGVDAEGRIVVSTYPQRAKAANARRDPEVSVCVLSDDFDGPWVQKNTLLPPTTRKLAAGPSRRAYVGHQRRAPRLGRVPRRHVAPGQVAAADHADRVGPDRHRGFPPELDKA